MLKPLIKSLIQGAAFVAGPQRWHWRTPRLWVLMYHRILPTEDRRFQYEEPGMVVSPQNFAMHLEQLRSYFTPMFLSDWIGRAHRGEALPSRCCAITFDDGWQDNFEYALPLLKQYQIPATLFAVADKIGTQFQFWPTIVAHLLSSGKLRQAIHEPIFTALHAQYPELSPNPEGCALAINFLKRFSDEEIYRALDVINWQCLADPLGPALMSWQQLKQMQDSGFVEVGSHTCTHRRLNNVLDESQVRYEIEHSKNVLQTQLGRPVNLFCFPNGDYTPLALSVVKETYQAAVTTKRGVYQLGQNLHEITRIGLHNDVSATRQAFAARLAAWL